MSRNPMKGGASGCNFHKTSLGSLAKQVEANPNSYRVGATSHDTPKQRMWTYPSSNKNAEVSYATTRDIRSAENQLLSKLPENHPHNVQRRSNVSEGPGCVYAINKQK